MKGDSINRKTVKIIILVLIFCSSCNKSNNIEKKENQDVIQKIDDILNTSLNNKTLNLLDRDIDVQNVKSQLDGVTTTFLSKTNTLIFPDRAKNNFYGYYTLIKKDKGGNPTNIVGNMVIYDSINPYKYEKNTDEFVEITLKDKGISLYDNKLEVGMKLSDLIKELGSDYKINDKTLTYRNNRKKAFFKIEDSLITKIKIGIYKDGIDENSLLKKVNW